MMPTPQDDRQQSVIINGVSHSFGSAENSVQALRDIHLTLAQGELVVLTGPSGSGKTTLLTLIGALRSLQQGSIRFHETELSQKTHVELTQVRRNIGFIFQDDNLFDALTAYQNVRIAIELGDHSEDEMRRASTEILHRLGLSDRLGHKPHELSGGQRQRVSIARALVNRPSLVLADEPTAALDQVSARLVMRIIRELVDEEACTVLIVTHDSRILDTADRIINLVDGQITGETVRPNPEQATRTNPPGVRPTTDE